MCLPYIPYIYINLIHFDGEGCAVGLIIGQNLILGHDIYYNCYTGLASNKLLTPYTCRQASIIIRVNLGEQLQCRGGYLMAFFLLHFLLNHGILNRIALFLDRLDLFTLFPAMEKSNFFNPFLMFTQFQKNTGLIILCCILKIYKAPSILF